MTNPQSTTNIHIHHLDRKKPPPGGDFLSINFILFPHNDSLKRIITLNDERRGGKNKRKELINNDNNNYKPSVHYKHTHTPLDTLPS